MSSLTTACTKFERHFRILEQGEWCHAGHGATGDQPEPKAEPDNSSDENSVGERHPGTLREGIVTDGRGLFAGLVEHFA